MVSLFQTCKSRCIRFPSKTLHDNHVFQHVTWRSIICLARFLGHIRLMRMALGQSASSFMLLGTQEVNEVIVPSLIRLFIILNISFYTRTLNYRPHLGSFAKKRNYCNYLRHKYKTGINVFLVSWPDGDKWCREAAVFGWVAARPRTGACNGTGNGLEVYARKMIY